MQYFTEKGPSHREVVKQIKEKYGDRAQIMTHRNIRIGGFLGLFSREGVEVSGIISNERQNRIKKDLENEKNRIITAAAAAQSREDKPSVSTIASPVKEEELPADMQKVLSELKEIKDKMGNVQAGDEGVHPSLEKAEELLGLNDFSFGFIKNIMKRLKGGTFSPRA